MCKLTAHFAYYIFTYRSTYLTDDSTLSDISRESRESVMLTAYEQLRYTNPSSLRTNFNVTFYNEPGIYKICNVKSLHEVVKIIILYVHSTV